MEEHIFVYDTLMTGFRNFRRYLARYQPSVVPAYTYGNLYHLESFAALQQGEGKVVGELMQFTPDEFPDVLSDLDRLQGYREGRKGNVRERVVQKIYPADGGDPIEAFVYLYIHPTARPTVPGGNWRDFIRQDNLLVARLCY